MSIFKGMYLHPEPIGFGPSALVKNHIANVMGTTIAAAAPTPITTNAMMARPNDARKAHAIGLKSSFLELNYLRPSIEGLRDFQVSL